MKAVWLLMLTLSLSGCSAATLPYKPETPSPGPPISADYGLLMDRLRVEIDTGGYRLEDAYLVTPEGVALRPQTIEHPPPGGGSTIGFGFGGGSWGHSSSSSVGVGSGVGVSVPLGGSGRVQGHTLIYFSADQAGPAPWRLFVKVSGANPAVILLPPR